MNLKTNGSRTKKLIRNSVVGAIAFGIQIIITFISRVVFIRYLGIEYLGVNDLYANLLSVLSLADLGFETVLMYSLYKPIANNDQVLICELVNTFKKLYRLIAVVVFVLGILLVPFLSQIIKDSGLNNQDLIVYYLFFLGNSVCSYLMVYKSALLQADQNVYIVKLIKAFTQLLCGVVQIVLIIVFRDYIAYLIAMLATTLINNLILSNKATRQYDFLSNRYVGALQTDIKEKLIENTKSVFWYKMGTTIVNSTTNIFISVIIGATMVGYYSNYYTVVAAIVSVTGIFNSSFIPAIGDYLSIHDDGEKRQLLFSTILLFYFMLATAFSSILLLCINQFIQFWIGDLYVLKWHTVFVIIFSFYFQCIAHPMWMFRETSGLFKEIKLCVLSMALLNIIFSYFLGEYLGLTGIIGATVLSRLITLFWYEPIVLNRNIFHTGIVKYWGKWIKYFSVSLLTMILVVPLLTNQLNTFWGMIAKALVVCLFTIILFFCFFRKSDEMTGLMSRLRMK